MDRPATTITDTTRDEDTARAALASGPSSFGQYCRTWFVGTLAIGAILGAFNAIIDPYLVIGAPRIPGLNAVKPETDTHTQLAKDYLVRRAQPAGVILGDSKVDIGLDPDSPAWPGNARPAFNYGIPGTAIADSIANLHRAIAAGPVRRALVLVEMSDFMAPNENEDTPSPGPAGVTALWQRVSDILLATLSFDAVTAGAKTIAAQYGHDAVDMSPHGATGDGGFRGAVADDGYDAVFLQRCL